MPDIAATVITPSQLKDSEAGGFDLKLFDKRYLAQGDSWFSIGHFPPWSTTNILFQLNRASSFRARCLKLDTLAKEPPAYS